MGGGAPLSPLTVNEVQERYNIIYQTAKTYLLGLAKLGYLNVWGTMSVFEAIPPINPPKKS